MSPDFQRLARRIAATLTDGLLSVGVALVLAMTPVGAFFAKRAVVMLQIDNPASYWKGTVPLVLGAVGEFSYALPFAFCLVVGMEAIFGQTVGKWLFGIRIASMGGEPRLSLRFLTKMVGFWGCVLGLLAGSWLVAFTGLLAECVVLMSLLLLRPLHERVSETRLELAR